MFTFGQQHALNLIHTWHLEALQAGLGLASKCKHPKTNPGRRNTWPHERAPNLFQSGTYWRYRRVMAGTCLPARAPNQSMGPRPIHAKLQTPRRLALHASAGNLNVCSGSGTMQCTALHPWTASCEGCSLSHAATVPAERGTLPPTYLGSWRAE